MRTKHTSTQQANEPGKAEHTDGTLRRVVPAAAEQVRPLAGRAIEWASVEDLEQELELRKSRQWLSEEMITTAQKHWHCSRVQAVKFLLRGLDECSA